MSFLETKAFQLEEEIRRLKLELMKEELSDKIVVLNAFLDAKSRNSTQNQVNTTRDMPGGGDGRFESVLFASVSGGDLLIWHVVLIMLFVWFLAGKLFYADLSFFWFRGG